MSEDSRDARPRHAADADSTERLTGRFAAVGVAALVAVWTGFIGLEVPLAERLIRNGGYYILFVTFAFAAYWIARQIRVAWPQRERMQTTQLVAVVAAIAVASLLAINAEPFRSKILNDEFVLQGTAFNMHFFREVGTLTRAYDILGTFLSTDNYLDKRPYFYPFLVSLVHDLTGYRPLNAFLVNAALYPATLWLVFLIARSLANWRAGLVIVALLGTLPLLGQNATGSGMELLNICMISAGILLAIEYLRAPADASLLAFVFGILLLAQSRYESALYVGVCGLIVILGWWRAGRVILPWSTAVVPLLLIPTALHQKVVANTPLLWELTENASTRFSLDYLAGNVSAAWRYLVATGNVHGNSLLLTALGLVSLVYVAIRFVRKCPKIRTLEPAALAVGVFAVGMLMNTGLVFCYYWSAFTDHMASRFALPLHLLLALATAVLIGSADRRFPAAWLGLLACLFIALPHAASRYAYHHYSHVGIDEIEWNRRVINARATDGERLIITNNSTLPWLLDGRPAVLLARARIVADRLDHQLHEPTFREILVLQSMRPTSVDGNHEIVPEEVLPSWFKLETVAEKRFGTKIARVSRLVDIQLPADYQSPLRGLNDTTE